MAELSTPPVERPELEAAGSSNQVEPANGSGAPSGAEPRVAAGLLESGELAFGVRLRIALDILEQAVEEAVELRPRTATSRYRLEGVRVSDDGVGRVEGAGAREGLGEIIGESVAGKPLGARPLPRPPPAEISDDV